MGSSNRTETGKGGTTVTINNVSAGRWKVSVEAVYQNSLYGTGEEYVDVEAGKLNTVNVTLKPPLPTYTVTFNSGGGSAVSSITAVHGTTINAPKNPTKADVYESKFDGWYKDDDFVSEWIFTSDTVTDNTTLYAKWVAYELGDTGPGGGKVIYMVPAGFTVQGHSSYDGGNGYGIDYTAYYLEAAPNDAISAATSWCNCPAGDGCKDSVGDVIGSGFVPDIGIRGSGAPNMTSIDAEIGKGRYYTAMIAAYHTGDAAANNAAKACLAYSTAYASDWFLPSIGELYWLYQNRSIIDSSFFISGVYYWSSSQFDNEYSWYIRGIDGARWGMPGSLDGTKNDLISSRPIRAF